MKLSIKFIPFSFIFLLNACSDSFEDFTVEGSGDVSYKITLNIDWSRSTHPDNFPIAVAHFSRLVGATHSINTTYWQEGDIASAAIEQMSESGGTSLLVEVVNGSIATNDSDKLILGDGLSSSPGSRSFTLPVNASHPSFTVVTMIAPSPDWFIGVSAYDLMPNGIWVDYDTVTLYAYDAGTDSGTSYGASNSDTNPQEPITKIINSPFLVNNNIAPIGQLIIEKL